MQKSYQEKSQHLQLQKFVSNPDGQKTTFFAATQNHHQTVRCISAEDEKNLFLKHKFILNSYFRIAYIS